MLNEVDHVQLERDCEAVEVPAGTKIRLPAGTGVVITQSLGGNFTVITDWGNMVQIASRDADALGKPVPLAPPPPGQNGRSLEDAVWEQLRTVYDPEIPVNIVDLGLVYRCELKPSPEGGSRVEIDMAMTAPGCGMGDYLKMDVESRLRAIPGVKEAAVEVVFEPQWDQSRMSEAARLQLGLM